MFEEISDVYGGVEMSYVWSVRTVQLGVLIMLVLAVTTAAAQETIELVGLAAAERMPYYERFFERFEEKTGIRVNFHQLASGGQTAKWELVLTRITGGLSPDLVTGTSVEFVPYAAVGLIQPLDEFIAREATKGNDVLGDLVPVLVDALQWQGLQYMIPYGANGVTLAYNGRLMQEAGVAPPPKEWGDPAWTWEAFLDMARKLTIKDSSGATLQYGVSGPYWDSWITLPYNWGGDWVDLESRLFLGNTDATISALQSLADLSWVYGVMPRAGEANEGYAGHNIFLNTETGAMAGYGSWGIQALIAKGDYFHLAPWFQVDDNRPVGAINPMGICMLTTAPNKEAAWEMLKFASADPEGNLLWSLAAGTMPAHVGAHQAWFETLSAMHPELGLAVIIDQVVNHGVTINIRRTTTFPDINALMVPCVNEVLANKKSAAMAMEEIAPIVQALVEFSEH